MMKEAQKGKQTRYWPRKRQDCEMFTIGDLAFRDSYKDLAPHMIFCICWIHVNCILRLKIRVGPTQCYRTNL